jgi:hypothetical protein
MSAIFTSTLSQLGIAGSGAGIEAVSSNEIIGPEGDEGEQRHDLPMITLR